jgi:hypothetical protein
MDPERISLQSVTRTWKLLIEIERDKTISMSFSLIGMQKLIIDDYRFFTLNLFRYLFIQINPRLLRKEKVTVKTPISFDI